MMLPSWKEKQYNNEVKIIPNDNGMKFTCMKKYFLEQRIVFKVLVSKPHKKSCSSWMYHDQWDIF